MSAPTGPAAGADTEEPAVAVFDVVQFEHVDPILGGRRELVGVVAQVDGDLVYVVPLQGYSLQVATSAVQVVTAAKAGAGADS